MGLEFMFCVMMYKNADLSHHRVNAQVLVIYDFVQELFNSVPFGWTLY